jgi:hypothetical protein
MCQSIVSAHYEYIYASCKYQEALVPLVPDHQQIPNPAQPLQIFGALQQAIPLPAPIPPLRQRQINQQAANQQVANQRPRLLEEAAARQQATAEAAVTPQRQVINPDAEWLQQCRCSLMRCRRWDLRISSILRLPLRKILRQSSITHIRIPVYPAYYYISHHDKQKLLAYFTH